MAIQQVDIIRRGPKRQLGQLRPADTNAASLYSPVSNIVTMISSVFISETSGTARTFRIFHDDNGTTFDETTALYFDVAIAANTTTPISLNIFMSDPAGNLAVRSSANSALTFTVYGEELT